MAKAWQSGDLVTNEDFNRYEQGLDEIEQQGNQLDNLLQEVANLELSKATKDALTTAITNSVSLKNFNTSRMYEVTENGVYLTPTSGLEDLPDGWGQGRHILIVFSNGNINYSAQFLIPYTGATSDKKMAFRVNLIANSRWEEIPRLANTYQLNRGNTHRFNTPTINPLSYREGHLELQTTDGSAPIIGFHTGGTSAVALYQKGGNLRMINNGGADREIATTEVVDLTPYLLNGWEAYANMELARSGNVVTFNIRIRNGVMTQSTNILQVPQSFRPTSFFQSIIFIDAPTGTPIGLGNIGTNGLLSIWSLSSNADVIVYGGYVL